MRNQSPPTPPERPSLAVPRVEAEAKISQQIAEGTEIIETPCVGGRRTGHIDWSEANARREVWRSYVAELLSRLFTTDAIVEEFRYKSYRLLGAASSGSDRSREYDLYQKRLETDLTNLRAIHKRLDLIPEADTKKSGRGPQVGSKLVFIVHGHDKQALTEAARFVERLGLTAVILHEQASAGRTLIEKFEAHSDAEFAIVLLTPDDVGGVKSALDAKPEEVVKNLRFRARQNVILELGYFMGRLGRGHVCALVKGKIEKPSDFDGVVYVAMDDQGAWSTSVARELKAAGVEFDASRLI